MVKRAIEKVVILGAGTMGARIAAHIANAGVWCALLDIAPAQLTAEDQKRGLALENPEVRNRIVRAGLAAAVKARPAAFFTRGLENRIVTGNFEDDLKLCAEADWIVEVVAENLEIKRALLSRVAQIRKPGTIVTTNTPGFCARLFIAIDPVWPLSGS
jgi:3-hydroxyacyl-CoA dehydrogenase